MHKRKNLWFEVCKKLRKNFGGQNPQHDEKKSFLQFYPFFIFFFFHFIHFSFFFFSFFFFTLNFSFFWLFQSIFCENSNSGFEKFPTKSNFVTKNRQDTVLNVYNVLYILYFAI